MFSHVMVGANDLESSRRFYDAVLNTLGIPPGVSITALDISTALLRGLSQSLNLSMGSLLLMPMVERLDFLLRHQSRCMLFMLQALPMAEPHAKSRQDQEKDHLVL